MFVNRTDKRKQKVSKMAVGEFDSIYSVVKKVSDDIVQYKKDLVEKVSRELVDEKTLIKAVEQLIIEKNYKLPSTSTQDLIKEVIDYIFGYGILQPFLDDEDCNGIFINRFDNIWVQKGNQRFQIDVSFGSKDNLLDFISKTVNKCGAVLNHDNAMTRFTDKKSKIRFTVAIEPIAYLSPWMVMRKHKEDHYDMKDLIYLGMLTEDMSEFMIKAQYANVIISGKGGSGKTTFLRAWLQEHIDSMRIMIMEESEELLLTHPNALHNIVKKKRRGEQYDLAKLADIGQLSTIDKYVFGEIRGEEAMVFFEGAFNGNITANTTHAYSGRGAIDKMMLNMKKSGTSLDREDLLRMLHSSVDLIVHMDKFRVREIVEVLDYDSKERFHTLYEFRADEVHNTYMIGQFVKKSDVYSPSLQDKLYR